jgi:hypothetical protein
VTYHPRFPAVALFALTVACESSTAPSSDGYAGQWNGTTAQGRAITFTISAAEAVTTITIGHEFNGCSGSQTFSGLSLSIAPQVQCIPGPCPSSVSSFRSFHYAAGDRLDGPSTDLNALFVSNARAEGTLNFRSYPGCGSAIGVPWSATRR